MKILEIAEVLRAGRFVAADSNLRQSHCSRVHLKAPEVFLGPTRSGSQQSARTAHEHTNLSLLSAHTHTHTRRQKIRARSSGSLREPAASDWLLSNANDDVALSCQLAARRNSQQFCFAQRTVGSGGGAAAALASRENRQQRWQSCRNGVSATRARAPLARPPPPSWECARTLSGSVALARWWRVKAPRDNSSLQVGSLVELQTRFND